MFVRRLQVVSWIFAAVDAFLLLLAFGVAYGIRDGLVPELAPSFPFLPAGPLYPMENYLGLVVGSIAAWLGVGYLVGVYRPRELRERRQALLEPTKQVAAAALVLAAGLFFLRGAYVSRLLLVLFVLFDWILQVAVRLAFIELGPRLRERLGAATHILLVGTGPAARQLAGLIQESKQAGLRLLGFVEVGENGSLAELPADELPCWHVEDVPELLRQHVVDEVFFAVSKEELAQLEDLLLLCEEEGVRSRVQLKIFPHLFSRVYVDRLRELPLLTFTSTPENELHLAAKRSMDALGAFLLLIFTSPLVLVIALLVKLTSHGPVFYKQVRCGIGGRRFTLYKFRSMRAGAHERRHEVAPFNEADGPVFKMVNDPRCTPVGRWLRRLSLDELPQLWNVLKGDMSFVGPRPPLPEEVEEYERWQRRRLRMRPGLTCLWAIEGRSRLSFEQWMKLDLAYIDNWSLWLDLKIFLRTIPLVLSGRGAA